MFAYEHKKLYLLIYTRMMDFLREKAKEGMENCRFLITFLIGILSRMTEKMLHCFQAAEASRKYQTLCNYP